MKRKILTLGVALLLTVALAGAAVAAVPTGAERPAHGFGRAMGGIIARVAEYLGVEVAVVQEARAEGQTLADILGDKTEAFVAATVTERQAFLAAMVESGKITAEQAEQCEAQMEERLRERLTSEKFGCGDRNFGQKHPMKKMMQRRQNNKTLMMNKGV